jgi:hypothetical protein
VSLLLLAGSFLVLLVVYARGLRRPDVL